MALVGTIRVGTISALMESLKNTGLSSALYLSSGSKEGKMTFGRGQLLSVQLADLDDSDAFDEMLSWSHGQFRLQVVDGSGPGLDEEALEDRPHVLVVDDEPGIRKLVETFLQSEGFRVSVVSQGNQALNMVEFCNPDVVLLDVMLTAVDGFEIALHLRMRYGDRMPVIMMSANHTYRERADEMGLLFFGKPFDFKLLCDVIRERSGTGPRAPAVSESRRLVRLPAGLASLLDAEAFLPDVQRHYVVDDIARARLTLAELDPEVDEAIEALDGESSLAEFLDAVPAERDRRALVALLLSSVGALRAADDLAPAAPDDGLERLLIEPEQVAPLVATSAEGEALSVFRVAVVGLRGSRLQEVRFELEALRAAHVRHVPREGARQEVPRLPDFELTRIPLADNALLVVYHVHGGEDIEHLVSLSESKQWGFLLHFVGVEALRSTINLVPSLTDRYRVPVLAAGIAEARAENHILPLVANRTMEDPHFQGVVLLQEGGFDKALRTILMSML